MFGPVLPLWATVLGLCIATPLHLQSSLPIKRDVEIRGQFGVRDCSPEQADRLWRGVEDMRKLASNAAAQPNTVPVRPTHCHLEVYADIGSTCRHGMHSLVTELVRSA